MCISFLPSTVYTRIYMYIYIHHSKNSDSLKEDTGRRGAKKMHDQECRLTKEKCARKEKREGMMAVEEERRKKEDERIQIKRKNKKKS